MPFLVPQIRDFSLAILLGYRVDGSLFLRANRLLDSADTPFGSLCKLAFPNPQYCPSFSPQGTVYQSITHPVRLQFISPESSIGVWKLAMFWTPMPEATVHEDRDARHAEYKIRPAQDLLVPAPAGNSIRPE
jgi:hypothetical protein